MRRKNRARILILLLILLALTAGASFLLLQEVKMVRAEREEAARLEEQARLEEEARIAAEKAAAAKAAREAAKAAEEESIASHVYSHRGSAGSYEHSFAAYDEAIAAGSRYIEQDIVLSADDVLFVSHDLSASRMTGVNRNFSSMSSSDIDELRTAQGEKILRLSEVFEKYQDSINYVIELKSLDNATIQAFEDIVDEYGLQDRIIAQATDSEILRILEEEYPDMPKLLVCKTQGQFNSAIEMSYIDIISVRAASGLMTEGNCEAAHEAGKVFSAWTLDYESEIRNAIDIGVDTYFTNDTALALLIEREYGLEVRKQEGSDV